MRPNTAASYYSVSVHLSFLIRPPHLFRRTICIWQMQLEVKFYTQTHIFSSSFSHFLFFMLTVDNAMGIGPAALWCCKHHVPSKWALGERNVTTNCHPVKNNISTPSSTQTRTSSLWRVCFLLFLFIYFTLFMPMLQVWHTYSPHIVSVHFWMSFDCIYCMSLSTVV